MIHPRMWSRWRTNDQIGQIPTTFFGSVIAAKCMISACMSWFLSGMTNIFFFKWKILSGKKTLKTFAVALNHSWVVGVSISVRIWELFGRKVSQYQNGPGDVLCPRAFALSDPSSQRDLLKTKYTNISEIHVWLTKQVKQRSNTNNNNKPVLWF